MVDYGTCTGFTDGIDSQMDTGKTNRPYPKSKGRRLRLPEYYRHIRSRVSWTIDQSDSTSVKTYTSVPWWVQIIDPFHTLSPSDFLVCPTLTQHILC